MKCIRIGSGARAVSFSPNDWDWQASDREYRRAIELNPDDAAAHRYAELGQLAEQLSSINCGCGDPIVQFGSHPIGNWNRSNVPSLADQINNGSMLFALLEMI
jgi:hypothetical protein